MSSKYIMDKEGLYFPRRLFTMLFMVLIIFVSFASSYAQKNQTPEELEGVGITEKLGDTISHDILVINEKGEEVPISNYLNNGRPVILSLVYYECPMLCNLLLNGLKQGVSELSWTPGNEYDILSVSISPEETHELAATKKENYLKELDRPGAETGWHFMTARESQVQKIAEEVGFGYAFDEETGEYMHSATLIFLSEEGTISRYLGGIDYPELTLRNALYDAADGKIGSTIDRMVLSCFRYDPDKDSYVPFAQNIMKLGGLGTILLLGIFLGIFWVREKKYNKSKLDT
ncbi:MAG: SCO family protein [Balneolales bacterium]